MIPIATEVEHITNYLKIQQMRYQDKIRFTLDMDRELYPYLTLKVLRASGGECHLSWHQEQGRAGHDHDYGETSG